MYNRIRITLGAFLAYFLMSAMLAPVGIISTPMADALDISVTEATALFGWLTTGILAGAIAALYVPGRIGLKPVFILVYVAITTALIALGLPLTVHGISAALATIGIGCGLGLAAAATTIAQSYAPRARASLLVITDGAFSVAGTISVAIAGFAVAGNRGWSFGYSALTAVAALIVVLAATSRYPSQTSAASDPVTTRWPPAVILSVAALFLYTLGQYGILWWLPLHVSKAGIMSLAEAGVLVERFWTGMFAGQIFVALLVLKTGARRLVLIAATCALAGAVAVSTISDARWLPALALGWGFFNLGLLKLVLSFATEQLRQPAASTVSLLLLGATCGTAISPTLSSRIADSGDTIAVLTFSSVCYVVMVLLLAIAHVISRRN